MKPYITKGTEFKTPDGILLAVAVRDVFENEKSTPNQFKFVGMKKPVLHEVVDQRFVDSFTAMGLSLWNP